MRSAIVFVLSVALMFACTVVRAEIVAEYDFYGNHGLTDISGNGHDLLNSGTVTWCGGGVIYGYGASFNGTGRLYTDDNVDLSPYTEVKVTWTEDNQLASGSTVAWEHSEAVGRIGAYETRGGVSYVLHTGAGGLGRGYTLGAYANPNGYSLMVADFNLITQTVTVTRDGSPVDYGFAYWTSDATPFINAVFSIGGRATEGFYQGAIGGLKIEGVPEPSSLMLLGTGVIGLLCYAWRRRK